MYCITETWLSDFVFDGEILSCGYVLYCKDRPTHGGGVLVAVNELLISSLIPSPIDLEVVTVLVGQNDSVISCVYVPPDSSFSYIDSFVDFFFWSYPLLVSVLLLVISIFQTLIGIL